MDPVGRLLVVGAVVVTGLVVIWAFRRQAERSGPPVDVVGLVEGRTAVVFTKDDCPTCLRALDRLDGLGIRVHQVRAEEQPEELESRGIDGVPVTVLIDGAGQVQGQFRGLPPRGALRRAVKRTA